MGYVIAAVLVLLIVGGLVLVLVNNATRKSNVSDAGDPGSEQNSLGIIGGDDQSPLGSTSEHTSEQSGHHDARDRDQSNVARPLVGGEAEGGRSTPPRG